jgi:tetratricopeptide (TPR) repeat protein
MTPSLRSILSEDRTAVASIFLLALVLRLVYLFEIRDSLYFATLVLDGFEYDRMAARLLGGDWLLHYEGGYVHGLLYPYVLAPLKFFSGPENFLPRLFQAILGSLSCVLVYRIAARCCQPPVHLIAGLLAAGYWPFLFYGGELLATTLVIFVELLLVILLLRGKDSGFSWALAGGAGLLLGLLVVTRSNLLLLLPVALGWIYLNARKAAYGWRRPLLSFSLAFVVALSPFLVRNYRVQGHPLPFQGGWSFYMGNNPDADGTPYARQGLVWQRLELLPLQQGIIDPAEKGIFYIGEALRFIREQPIDYLALLYRKFRLFWHAFEIPVSADMRYCEDYSLLSRILAIGFGTVAPLALIGMGWSWSRRRDLFLLYGFVLAYLASGLLFSVCARYRLPAVPFLMVFAACGLREIWMLVRQRNVLQGEIALLALGLSIALVHTGIDVDQVDHLRSDWLQGHAHLRRQEFGLAERAYLDGLRKFPDDADIHNSLGVVREHQRQDGEAEASYLKALEIAPDHARARVNLGKLYLKQRQLEKAGAAFEEAIARDPRPANQREAHHHLGYVYLFQQSFQQAHQAFTRALEAREHPQTYYGLANACAQLGMAREQMRALERAVQLEPEFAPALRNLGALYLQQGDLVAAEKALQKAVRYDPSSPVGYRHLGALYQRLGRQEQARAAFESARRLSEGR